MKGTNYMAHKVADTCRNCGAELAPGAAFCTLCGAAVANRAASAGAHDVPLSGAGRGGSANAGSVQDSTVVPTSIPGIITVGGLSPHPVVRPRHPGVDARLAEGTVLVPGGAGRRLVAWVIDCVVPVILTTVAAIIGAMLIEVTTNGTQKTVDLTWLLVLLSIASVLSLGYWVWTWLWDAKQGKTVGNVIMGLRTTNMEGRPAGLLAIFLRYLIVSVSSVVPTIGPLLVTLSNIWDSNEKKQGWHDKVAHTLVFNVKAGRDPLETGGITGRTSYTPAAMPGISPVSSPLLPGPQTPTPNVASRTTRDQFPPEQKTSYRTGPDSSAPSQPISFPQAPAPETFAPITSVPGITQTGAQTGDQTGGQSGAPLSAQPSPRVPVQQSHLASPQELAFAAQAEDDAGETRVRPVAQQPVSLRLLFDDGRTEDVEGLALIGRNPAGYDGEMISRLISVLDTSRSVSKTHLHLRTSVEGLWVTDRNSTNGSAITIPSGRTTPLLGGSPALAEIGARVHFGDRSFMVGRA